MSANNQNISIKGGVKVKKVSQKPQMINREVVMPDGALFKGKAFKNLLSGFGTLMWPDNSTYEGQIKKGLLHGQGTKTWLVDETRQNQYKVYTGTWAYGKMEG